MKKLILTLALGLCVMFASAQTNPAAYYRIANGTTQFGINLPVGTLIYDVGANAYYVLTAAALSTATLGTATKTALDMSASNEFQNLTWDAANGHIEISDGNDADIGNFSTSGTDKGFVPGSNGATTSFLKGDGTWATPPGGGDVSATGSPVSPQIAYWASGTTIDGDANLTWQTEGLRFGTTYGISTGQSVGNTVVIKAYDTDGASYTTLLTATAGTTPALNLAAGTTINSNAIAYSGGAFHDGFSDFVANEHIDWTTDQGATNIHSGNYTDTDTDDQNLSWDAPNNQVDIDGGGTSATIPLFSTSATTYGLVIGSNSVGATYYLNGSGAWSVPAGDGQGVTSVAAGNGMNFTTITTTGSVTLGTPTSVTGTSTNSVTSNSHTHEVTTGIAQNSIVEVSAADVANGEYARFTSTGLESRSSSEVASDLNVEHWKVEHFTESTTGSDGDTHALGQTPDNSSGISVLLNGLPLTTSQYTYTPGGPSVEITIPVYQYDRVMVAYGY